jgi:hypothetical protein
MIDATDEARWWKRPTAPGPLGATLAADAILLLPAVLGAILAWAWWLTILLMIPGIVLHQRIGWAAARELGLQTRSESKRTQMVLGGIVGGLCGIFVNVVPHQYFGLVVACISIVANLTTRRWLSEQARHRSTLLSDVD